MVAVICEANWKVEVARWTAAVGSRHESHRKRAAVRPRARIRYLREESDVFYAFIEYQDAIGVQNALKASPIQLNGRLIHVEGRRPNSGVSRGNTQW
ncbi:hypothetical protein ZIOFF_052396 [Zingiber officinale]|uniref:RRM domain-containing protein n=1 Tax=Zingiber officinale TaxID=94328 RepID=A0A8J5G3V9_ZINOF|nr:hypothetical protein ZIOFF_052396 [Zingiber officinale]